MPRLDPELFTHSSISGNDPSQQDKRRRILARARVTDQTRDSETSECWLHQTHLAPAWLANISEEKE